MAEASPPPRRRLIARALTRADLAVVALYIALPTALYLPFSVAGRPLMVGDDLYQNYPLRVLAGRFLAAGQIPAWDPFIWSGTPLLAGWNAGALFPGTWLFAVLPPIAAWTVNLVLASSVGAIGLYAFLRRLGCGTLASFLGGLVFSYTGFMSGQLVHLGLAQGTTFLPWLLLGVECLAHDVGWGRFWGWVALLGVASALTVLAGDPRAISTSAIALVIYLLAWLLRDPGRTLRRVLPGVALGAALGALLSAVQWLPGIRFVSSSQRGVNASALFSAGSLSLAHIAGQLLVPFMLGGSTNFGMIVYQGLDNIQELTIGVGLVALAAALAYIPELLASWWAWLSRMVRPAQEDLGTGIGLAGGRPATARRLTVWYVIGACGVVLTMGSDTRLGSVLVHIPLYGGERLQNRNAELIDLALIVLLAFFVDDLAGRSRRLLDAWRPLVGWPSGLLAAIAPLAALVLVLAGLVDPVRVEHLLEMPIRVEPRLFEQTGPYLIATALFAVLLAIFLLVVPRLPARLGRVLLVVFVLGDVLTYALNASYAAPRVSSYGAGSPGARAVAADTGTSGRFAIFDPEFSFPPTGMEEPDSIGLPDIDILQHIATVEGYGSIVDSNYQNATATHGVEDLNQSELGGSTFDSLDLRTLLTLPVYIWRQIGRHEAVPVAGVGTGTKSRVAPPLASGPFTIQPGGSETFLMAKPSALVRATAFVVPETRGTPPTLKIAEGDAVPSGTPPLVVDNGLAVTGFPAGRVVDSVVVENSSDVPAVVGAVTIVTRHPALRYVLDGALQGDVAPPHWRYAGLVHTPAGDNFIAFENERTAGEAWLQPDGSQRASPSRRLRAGTVTVRPAPVTSPQTIAVNSTVPAELVRSVAYSAGWTATIAPVNGGAARRVEVSALGLVQMVRVPAGRSVVTWHYSPRSLRDGELLTLLGVLALLAIPAGLLVVRRRQRPPRQGFETSPEG